MVHEGVRGAPPGIMEIYGLDSTGKTSLALSVGREAALRGLPVMFINMEHDADPAFVRRVIGDCVYSSPPCGEAAVETAYAGIRSGVRVVVIDTVDAMIPLTECNLPVGERAFLAHRRLVYHGFTVLNELAHSKDALVVVTSQVRENPKERYPSPKASFHRELHHKAGSIIQLHKKSTLGEYGVVKYYKIRARLEKYRNSAPNDEEYIYLWSGAGFDRNYELLLKLMHDGRLTRRGSYWAHGGVSIGPGYEEATKAIARNNDSYAKLAGVTNETDSNNG